MTATLALRRREHMEMESRGVRLATHTDTTAVNRSMHRKLQQMPEKTQFTCLDNSVPYLIACSESYLILI